MNKTDVSYMVANDVLRELKDRSGFGNWWYNIDVDIQNEIRNELAKIIYKSLENDND